MTQPWTFSSPNAKAYDRVNEHFVEPLWCSKRLFEEERFPDKVYDPACGFGNIVRSALNAGHDAYGSDIVDRGHFDIFEPQDFLKHNDMHDSICSNPPFDIFEDFAQHALVRAHKKVALIMPTARLNAARWLESTPLRRVWLLTPRPSMPPGHVIKSNGHVGGGKSDYCWLVFEHGYHGKPEMRWLRRDVP